MNHINNINNIDVLIDNIKIGCIKQDEKVFEPEKNQIVPEKKYHQYIFFIISSLIDNKDNKYDKYHQLSKNQNICALSFITNHLSILDRDEAEKYFNSRLISALKKSNTITAFLTVIRSPDLSMANESLALTLILDCQIVPINVDALNINCS